MYRWGIACGLVLLVGVAEAGRGQQPPSVVRGRDIASVIPQLRRQISLKLEGTSIDAALQVVAHKAALPITYNDAVLPAARKVWLSAENIRTDRALEEILRGSGLHLLALSTGQVVVVRDGATWADGYEPSGVAVVSGRVTAKKTGTPLVAANLVLALADTVRHAVSDDSGKFAFANVPPGEHRITARFVGYRPLTRGVVIDSTPARVDFALEEQAARLEELVSTATGRRRRMDIANDVTTINADSVMQAAPIRTLTDLLETRVPSLTVQRTSGAPGDPARLRLRGASSVLGSNDPIVIVDGIRVYANQSASRSANLARNPTGTGIGNSYKATSDTSAGSGFTSATPSPLDYVDPNVIDKIEVLKGPSAATLYGQDAANGVIVITTKKGRPGPARWTASLEHGRTRISGEYPELLYRWGHNIFTNDLVNCPASNIITTPLGALPCRGDSILAFQLLNDPALTVLDRGRRTALSLGVSGGTQALTYVVTTSYADEMGLVRLPNYEVDRYRTLLGITPPDWMRRPQAFTQWGVTSGVTARLSAKAEVTLTAGLSRTDQQKSSIQDELGALMATYLDRGSGRYYRGTQPASSTNPNAPGNSILSSIVNPLADYYQRAIDVATQFTNGASLSYRPSHWLTVTADAGLNVVQRADQVYVPRGPDVGTVDQPDTVGRINDGQGRSIVSSMNLRAYALRPLGRGFQARFAAGVNYTGTSVTDVAGGSRYLAPGSSLQGDTMTFLRRNEASDATFGWYLEPSVGNSRFNFTSGLRLDGGSSYGASVSGLSLPKFPKLGFSYLVSDEPWFPFANVVQSLRLRLSYGRAGRQPGPKDKLRLYGTPRQVFADSQFLTALELQTLGNTEVRPERSAEFEGGLDADLLASRLAVSITGYRKTTDDMLLPVPVAPEIYGSDVRIVKNIGVVRNSGLELDVGAQLVRRGPIAWTTQLNLSHRREVLLRLAPGMLPFYTNSNVGSAAPGGIRVAPGYPLYGRWSRPILGYADANGNGIVSAGEVQLGDTAVYVGSTLPNYTAALSTTVSLWHGAVTVNATLSHEDGLSQRNEVAKTLAPFARGAQVPGASAAEQVSTINLSTSDYNWIQTVSTTRLHSIGVRYAVPAAVVRLVRAQTLAVAVQGSNLGLWTNYRGLDPNVNAFGTGNNVTDTGILPQPRTWQVRVSATY